MKKLLFVSLLTLIVLPLAAAEKTVFELIAAGNDLVGAESRDKVVQVRSEKSVGALTPSVWYVVFREPNSTFKTVEIKFGNGRKLSMYHPWRVLESTVGNNAAFNKSHLKKDSDEALKLATSHPELAGLKLVTSKFELTKGSQPYPTWKIELWAQKRSDPSRDVSVGDIWISAYDGRIIQAKLKPGRAQ